MDVPRIRRVLLIGSIKEEENTMNEQIEQVKQFYRQIEQVIATAGVITKSDSFYPWQMSQALGLLIQAQDAVKEGLGTLLSNEVLKKETV